MNIYTILGIAFSLVLTGFGIGIGLRLLKLTRRARTKAGQQLNDESDTGREQRSEAAGLRRRLSRPKGARRTTTIHGVNTLGYLRHTDGSYTKAYHVEMPATLYADDVTVDRIYNDWARMLQNLKLQGCIVQARHDVWPDSGRPCTPTSKRRRIPKILSCQRECSIRSDSPEQKARRVQGSIKMIS